MLLLVRDRLFHGRASPCFSFLFIPLHTSVNTWMCIYTRLIYIYRRQTFFPSFFLEKKQTKHNKKSFRTGYLLPVDVYIIDFQCIVKASVVSDVRRETRLYIYLYNVVALFFRSYLFLFIFFFSFCCRGRGKERISWYHVPERLPYITSLDVMPLNLYYWTYSHWPRASVTVSSYFIFFSSSLLSLKSHFNIVNGNRTTEP